MNLTPKAASAGVAGAFTIILVWIIGLFHVTVPPEIASAITTIISFLAAYLAPRSDPTPDQVVDILRKHTDQQHNP